MQLSVARPRATGAGIRGANNMPTLFLIWERPVNLAMHLRNVVCAREFLDSSATYFAVSMTEVLRVLFLEIKSSFALNKEVIDQMVHRAISFLLRIAYAITKFGAPRDDRVTTNELQVGWDTPSFLPPHSPTYRARPRNASARENGCHGPNRTEATSHVWNRSWRHPREFQYV